jgi:hypothetical protein
MSDHSGFKPPDDETGHDDVHDDAEGIRVVGPSNPMPHWTEPATSEMPRLLFDEEPAAPDEDLEAWSSFAATTLAQLRRRLGRRHRHRRVRRLRARVGALDSGSEESSGVFVFDDTTEPPTDPARSHAYPHGAQRRTGASPPQPRRSAPAQPGEVDDGTQAARAHEPPRRRRAGERRARCRS